MNMNNTNDKNKLLRDFLIVNITGGVCMLAMFFGMLLQVKGIIPKTSGAFYGITHMYCPGCGGTRSLFSLLKLNIKKSICYNPAVILGGVLILYYEITFIMTLLDKEGRKYYCKSPVIIYIYIAVVLIYTILRNVLLIAFGIDLLAG